ncbi:hypothetical protein WA158_007954 [Blastocystis sp. Blastoise]
MEPDLSVNDHFLMYTLSSVYVTYFYSTTDANNEVVIGKILKGLSGKKFQGCEYIPINRKSKEPLTVASNLYTIISPENEDKCHVILSQCTNKDTISQVDFILAQQINKEMQEESKRPIQSVYRRDDNEQNSINSKHDSEKSQSTLQGDHYDNYSQSHEDNSSISPYESVYYDKKSSNSSSKRSMDFSVHNLRRHIGYNHINQKKCIYCSQYIDYYPYAITCSICRNTYHRKCTWGSYYMDENNDRFWKCNRCIVDTFVYIYDPHILKYRYAKIDRCLDHTHIVKFQDTLEVYEYDLSQYKVVREEMKNRIKDNIYEKPVVPHTMNIQVLTFNSCLFHNPKEQVDQIFTRRWNPRNYIECLVKLSNKSILESVWIPQYQIPMKTEDILGRYLLNNGLKSDVWRKTISRREETYNQIEFSPLLLPAFQLEGILEEQTACCICKKNDHPEKNLLCEICDSEYHIYCLNPPLRKVPEDSWICDDCKRNPDKHNKYPKGCYYTVRFMNQSETIIDSALLASYPYGRELIYMYRRHDEEFDDKKAIDEGSEDKPIPTLPPLQSTIRNTLFTGNELFRGNRKVFNNQVPIISRLLQSLYTYKHTALLYSPDSTYRISIAVVLYYLFKNHVLNESVLLLVDDDALREWELILKKWTTLKVKRLSENAGARRDEWRDICGDVGAYILCSMDIIIGSNKMMKKKSITEKEIVDLKQVKLADDECHYDRFLLMQSVDTYSTSTSPAIYPIKELFKWIDGRDEDEIPAGTGDMIPIEEGRREQRKRWKLALDSDINKAGKSQIETVFPPITIIESPERDNALIHDYFVPCYMSQLQEYALQSIDCSKEDEENISSLYTELLKAYDHPFLIGGIEYIINEEFKQNSWKDNFFYSSGKVEMLTNIIHRLMSYKKNKLVVYSRDNMMNKLLYKYFKLSSFSTYILQGVHSLSEYVDIIHQFQQNSAFSLLILGCICPSINLPLDFVDEIVLYDSDCVPSFDINGLKTTYNIGTLFSCNIYRLTCVGTTETLVFDPREKLRTINDKMLTGQMQSLKEILLRCSMCLESKIYKDFIKTKTNEKAAFIEFYLLDSMTHLLPEKTYQILHSALPLYVLESLPIDIKPLTSLQSLPAQYLLEAIWSAKDAHTFNNIYTTLFSFLPDSIIKDDFVSPPTSDSPTVLSYFLYEYVISQFLLYSYPYNATHISIEETSKNRKTPKQFQAKTPREKMDKESLATICGKLTVSLYKCRDVLNYRIYTNVPYSDIFEMILFRKIHRSSSIEKQ